jgi:ABC-type Zn2+ transport system substrate-binding protein/surface adhesin
MAWHFMSPEGHAELKHAHDHKDFDIFVVPEDAGVVAAVLKENGFEKVPTKYAPGNDDFRRYEKIVRINEKDLRVTIDMFVREVPWREHKDGWMFVEPSYLVNLYSSIHDSKSCFAVVAAKKLLKQGIDPEGRSELVEIPK